MGEVTKTKMNPLILENFIGSGCITDRVLNNENVYNKVDDDDEEPMDDDDDDDDDDEEEDDDGENNNKEDNDDEEGNNDEEEQEEDDDNDGDENEEEDEGSNDDEDDNDMSDEDDDDDNNNANPFLSEKFQWLPSDITVNESGTECKFNSYINNLHPIRHKKLYKTFEKIFSRMLPLFASVLTDLKYPIKRRDEVGMFNLYSGEPQYEDFKDDADEKYGLVYEEWRENRKINLDPKIEPYEKKKKEKKKSMINLNGRKLQIIVKLASIHLEKDNDNDDDG